MKGLIVGDWLSRQNEWDGGTRETASDRWFTYPQKMYSAQYSGAGPSFICRQSRSSNRYASRGSSRAASILCSQVLIAGSARFGTTAVVGTWKASNAGRGRMTSCVAGNPCRVGEEQCHFIHPRRNRQVAKRSPSTRFSRRVGAGRSMGRPDGPHGVHGIAEFLPGTSGGRLALDCRLVPRVAAVSKAPASDSVLIAAPQGPRGSARGPTVSGRSVMDMDPCEHPRFSTLTKAFSTISVRIRHESG